MDSDVVQTMIAATVIMALLGSVLGAGLFSSTIATEQDAVEMMDGAGTFEGSGIGDSVNVTSAESTLGDAVYLTGSNDSQVAATSDVELGDSWSACTYSRADNTVVGNGSTRALMGVETDRYEIVIAYDDSAGEYRGWFYDAVDRSSHAATVAAPDPSNLTLVCAMHNETADTFQVSQNTTRGSAADTSGQGFANRGEADNWHGVLEETRLYPDPLTDANLARWVNEPVMSVEGTAPEARVMYDVRDRSDSSVPVYFGGGSVTLQNAQFVDGATGPELVEGEDYNQVGALRSWWHGGNIVALDGSELTGHGDVVFLTYDVDESSIRLIQLGFALFMLLFFAVAIQRKLP